MSHPIRFDGPGAVHHVWAHAVDRELLFADESDRERYLTILGRVLRGSGVTCLAWCLMDNHVHLVLRSGETHLFRVLLRIQTTYAIWFNRRHARRGYVFRARYGSRLHGENDRVGSTVAYVHLNACDIPGVDGVPELASYRWCGHAALLGQAEPRFLDVDAALALFGEDRRTARRNLLEEMAERLAEKRRGEGRPAPTPLHLPDRVQQDEKLLGVAGLAPAAARAHAQVEAMDSRNGRACAWRHAGGTVERLLDVICAQLSVDAAAVRLGRRTAPAARARAVLAHIACDLLAVPCAEVARVTGVTIAAVCRARDRGRQLVELVGATPGELLTWSCSRPGGMPGGAASRTG